MDRTRLGLAGGLCIALLLAPLLFLREPTAPDRGAVLAAAGPADADLVARRLLARAGRGEGRSAPTTAAPAPTTTAAPPPTTVVRHVHAVAAVAPPTTVRKAPATTTTTTTRPPAPTTTAPPPPPTTAAPATHRQTGEASWYAGPDGECAHNTAPIGTVLTITAVATGRATTCRVTGRGPFNARVVDLTKTTFARIADPSRGVVTVHVDW